MAGLIEDLLAGLPQAYTTLEELLAQSKLGRQHYGPRDSMIASAIAHPIEGAQKAGQWLQDQMMTASRSPVQPMTDPRGAEAGSQAGMNLAGLMQTGGLPAAPTGPGVLGTIRGSKIKEVLADLEAKGFDAKNPWYHGTAEQLQGEPRLPLFLTQDKAIAEQIARAKATSLDTPMLYKIALEADRPYDATKVYGDDAYKTLMENAGLNADELAANSPNGIKNLIDSIYSEDAQKVLTSKGHSSLNMWDNLDGKEFITKAVIKPNFIKIKSGKALKKK